MKISEIVPRSHINDDVKGTEKEDVIRELVGVLVEAGELTKKQSADIIKALMDREALGSTGIGQGIAVPHAKHDSLKKLLGVFGLARRGVNFNALDGEPVYIFFLLLSPKKEAGVHLEALAYISRLLRNELFCKFLREAKSKDEIANLLVEVDEKFAGG